MVYSPGIDSGNRVHLVAYLNYAALIPDKVMTDTLGDDVIYQATGGPVAIKAMFVAFVNPVFSGDSHLSENRKQLDVAVADVPGFKKGSVFTVSGTNYTVDDIISNDGYFATLVLR